jgi:hypothetical protein
LSWVPTSVNEFEVFVAGRRLRKNSISQYSAVLGMDSPEADVTLPPEFSVTVTTLTSTAATGSGTVATITFATQSTIPFTVGQTILVSGMTPDYNGLHTVTACTNSTVSFASTITGSQTSIGVIKGSMFELLTAPPIGTKIMLVRKIGKLWNVDTALSQTENIVANFIRAKEVSLPQ